MAATFGDPTKRWVCVHAGIIAFGKSGGIVRVSKQNLLLLAYVKALGVCPCSILLLWQNRRHWACAQAEFIALAQLEALVSCRCRILLLWPN